ncbi:hypothetical protein [Novosphingobium indicum]|nr:hypothetical protein [Novosphingobium indicum]
MLADRIASAIRDTGSPDYAVRSGALLALLSDLAREGDLMGMSEAFCAYTTLLPADEKSIRHAVPAKIINQYFHLNRKRSQRAIIAWQAQSEGWETNLATAIGEDVRFDAAVRAMDDRIKQSELS